MTSVGINVVGYLHAENGIGEGARLLLSAADAAGIPHSEVTLSGPHRDLHPYEGKDAFAAPRELNVVCVNADVFEPIGDWLHNTALGDRPTVGWWAWEVEQFPEWMAANARYLDAIWTNGNLARQAIAPAVDVPVHTFNPPIPLRRPTSAPHRGSLGLPDGFVFLFCFDYLSVFDRKNPIAVVEAFTRAFAPGEGPTLVIKGVNAERVPAQRDALVTAAGGRPDVRIWHHYVDVQNQSHLMAACDAYVSLHRSEGFGLTLAEAMAYGKPVIGTGYSGNLDFMTEENSFLVPYAMTSVPTGADPYPPGAPWAEPDVGAAAALMRRVVADPTEVARRVSTAQRDLHEQHSLAVRGQQLDALLRGLQRRERPPLRPRPERRTMKQRARKGIVSRARRLTGVEELLGRLDALDARVDWLHRATAQRMDSLDHELQRLAAQLEGAPYISDTAALRVVGDDGRERMGFNTAAQSSFYEDFERLFRGPDDMVRDRLAVYVPLLSDHAPVVDLGCGRGELLDLLSAASIAASGVEIDPAVARTPQGKGHRVEVADARVTLAATAAQSLGAVFSSQVVEHMTTTDLVDLIAAAKRALRPGGLFVAETVNPHSIAALRMFWLDPTHVRPVYPEALLLLCRAAGFARGYVLYPNGTGDLEADRAGAGEYAVIAELA
ncbi:MAG TPA: methyltransferase domain-containing protein [Acidimicrobiales bacterium]|nr:methyltransferase domain-containing protein [Acidimicrobiales bacterium]